MKTNVAIKSILDFNKKTLLTGLLAAGMGMGMGSVSLAAATADGDMTVSATLTSSCSVSASALAFGDIAALDTAAAVTGDTASTLEIACTTGTTTPLIYSATTLRTMVGSGSAEGGVLPFNLSQAAGAAADDLPSNAAAGEAIVDPWSANGAAQVVTIYGLIPTTSFEAQPIGPYSTTIVISVDYT